MPAVRRRIDWFDHLPFLPLVSSMKKLKLKKWSHSMERDDPAIFRMALQQPSVIRGHSGTHLITDVSNSFFFFSFIVRTHSYRWYPLVCNSRCLSFNLTLSLPLKKVDIVTPVGCWLSIPTTPFRHWGLVSQIPFPVWFQASLLKKGTRGRFGRQREKGKRKPLSWEATRWSSIRDFPTSSHFAGQVARHDIFLDWPQAQLSQPFQGFEITSDCFLVPVPTAVQFLPHLYKP